MGAKTFIDPLDIACHTKSMNDAELFNTESVRVLRHQFEASESLRNRLSHLIAPEHLAKESLKLYSLGLATYRLPQRGLYRPSELEEVQTTLAREEKHIAQLARTFAAQRERVPIADDELHPVKYMRTEHNEMRILFSPKDAEQFARVTDTFAHIDDHSEIAHHPAPHSLFYVDIAASSLIRNRTQLQEARIDLETNRRLYSLTPLQLDQKDIHVKTSRYNTRDSLLSFLPGVG